MAEVKAADAGGGHHGHLVGHAHADFARAQQLEQGLLDGVIGAGGVAGRGADALVLFGNQFGVIQRLVSGVAPPVGAHAAVQPFGAGFGQAVGQGFEEDGVVVVVAGQELGGFFFHADAGGDGECADVVLQHGAIVAALGPVARCDEVGQAAAGAVQAGFRVFGALGLLAQAVPGEQHAIAVFVGVEGDVVVVHAVGGPKAHHGVGGQPAAFDDVAQHLLAVFVDLRGFRTHDFVLQDGWEFARQVPGLEKRPPVHEGGQLGQRQVADDAAAQKVRRGRLVAAPVNGRFVGARLRQAPHCGGLFARVQLAHVFIVGLHFGHVLRRAFAQQALGHAHAARGVGHVNHGAFVVRGNFHGGMHAAGGGATNEQRNLAHAEIVVLLHFAGDVLHFFQAGGDQA